MDFPFNPVPSLRTEIKNNTIFYSQLIVQIRLKGNAVLQVGRLTEGTTAKVH